MVTTFRHQQLVLSALVMLANAHSKLILLHVALDFLSLMVNVYNVQLIMPHVNPPSKDLHVYLDITTFQ
jgi:hypothetical protein